MKNVTKSLTVCILKVIKTWTVGRYKNEAIYLLFIPRPGFLSLQEWTSVLDLYQGHPAGQVLAIYHLSGNM